MRTGPDICNTCSKRGGEVRSKAPRFGLWGLVLNRHKDGRNISRGVIEAFVRKVGLSAAPPLFVLWQNEDACHKPIPGAENDRAQSGVPIGSMYQ